MKICINCVHCIEIGPKDSPFGRSDMERHFAPTKWQSLRNALEKFWNAIT